MIVAGSSLILIGCTFCFLAALGVLRFPDALTRMHASAKAGMPGAGLVLAGTAVASSDGVTAAWAAVGIVFLLVAAPVSAHLLAKATLKGDSSQNVKLNIDEYVRED
jgi:multicomponent Na+:H+ antiporter subunit G